MGRERVGENTMTFLFVFVFLSMYDSQFLLRSSKLLAENPFHNILLPVRLECVNTHVIIS